ncbi:MAG TPA: glycosyltransferase, partial [Chryseosolibacter sp.]|nr:glycosyltransferase [Chryseosolibacter sp.]
MKDKPRLLRVTTVPISLKLLLKGQLSFFANQGFDVLAASSPGPEVDALGQQGVAHAAIPMTRKITPLRDLQSLWQLVRLMHRYKPVIVHTHTPKAGLLGMIAAWMCRVPIRLHTVAGLPLMEAAGLKRQVLLVTERLTYLCATHVYPNSRGLQDFIVSHIRTRTPVSVIG